MPVQKYSAMDPGGSWNMDARDQAAMWNANRGDQWTQFNINRADRGDQNAWQRDVAMAQLGLNRDMWQGGRQDSATAAERHYGWLEKTDAAKNALEQRRLAMEEADRAEDLDYRSADRTWTLAQRAREDAARESMANIDPASFGISDPKHAESLKLMAKQNPAFIQQVLAARLGRGLDREFVPQERADAGERARSDEAAAIIARIQGKDAVTPKEKQQLAIARSEREKQGYGAGLGVDPQDATAAEFAKAQIEAISKQAKEAASGIFGIVNQSERDALKQQASELLRVLKRAGYDEAALNSVWSQIESDLMKTQTGIFGDTFMSPGWTSSDIDEVRRGFR